MPLCNSISSALQWLIHGVDGSQYKQVLLKSMFTTTSCHAWARGGFWSDQADLHQPDWRIRLCSSHAWEGCRKARMRLSMPSWSGICGANRDLLVLKGWSYQHIWLQPALIMELSPSWLFNAKSGCTTGSFTDPVCNFAKRVRKAEVKAGEKQKYRRKALRKSFKEKETFWGESSGSRGPNLWAWGLLTTIPVSDMCTVILEILVS